MFNINQSTVKKKVIFLLTLPLKGARHFTVTLLELQPTNMFCTPLQKHFEEHRKDSIKPSQKKNQ